MTSHIKRLMTMKPEAEVVDKYGGAVFTIAEVTCLITAMMHTDTKETIEQFCERFVVEGSIKGNQIVSPDLHTRAARATSARTRYHDRSVRELVENFLADQVRDGESWFDDMTESEREKFAVEMANHVQSEIEDYMKYHANTADRTTCPDCQGSGVMIALTFIKYAPGHTGPPSRELPCMFCRGEKTVSAEQLRWKREGQNIKAYRRANDLTLRGAAERWGLKPSEVSTLEQGRADNTHWRRRFGIDQP